MFSVGKEHGNFLEALRESPTSAIVIVVSFFGMWTVIGLAGFHTYLIAVEQTTNEDVSWPLGLYVQLILSQYFYGVLINN